MPNCTTAAAAKITGHERRVEHGIVKTSEPSGTAQTINLGVCYRIALLHSFVMADRQQISLARQSGTDGNSAFTQTLLACAMAASINSCSLISFR
jgi:hypothetical protein